MHKKGGTSLMLEHIIYIVIFISFFIVMYSFVNSYADRSAFFEDFYSKKISQAINSAKPGTEFKIDITPLAVTAFKRNKPIKDLVYIDNLNNEVVVSSRLNAGTSFKFFNDVDVVDWFVESPSGDSKTTRFIFKVKENQRNEI